MPVPLGWEWKNWGCAGIWCVGGGLSVWGKKYGALLGAGFLCMGGEKKQPQHPPHAHSKNEKNRIVP